MGKIHITGIKNFYFSNLERHRQKTLDQYRSRFVGLDERAFCALFFKVGLREYEIASGDKACRFHPLLGVAND